MARNGRKANGGLACIVLAAGKGTRMRSAHVKVLHPLLGPPLVSYPVQLATDLGAVEQKDATREEAAIGEINAGIYAAPADFLRTAPAGLSARNAQRECYLPDIVSRAARSIGVSAVDAGFHDVAGVNDRRQLGES